MGFQIEYTVRYGECDRQGVVFNSHYQAYLDDAVDVWLRRLDPEFESRGWELMVKKAEIEWLASAGVGDVLALDLHVSRWGNTSFDVTCVGAVGDRRCIDATMVYVVVDTRDHRPMPAPAELREHLG